MTINTQNNILIPMSDETCRSSNENRNPKLITTNLNSCVAVYMAGSKGRSLTHLSSSINYIPQDLIYTTQRVVNTIKREMEFTGDVQDIRIVLGRTIRKQDVNPICDTIEESLRKSDKTRNPRPYFTQLMQENINSIYMPPENHIDNITLNTVIHSRTTQENVDISNYNLAATFFCNLFHHAPLNGDLLMPQIVKGNKSTQRHIPRTIQTKIDRLERDPEYLTEAIEQLKKVSAENRNIPSEFNEEVAKTLIRGNLKILRDVGKNRGVSL